MLTSGKSRNISTSKLHATAKDGKFMLFPLRLGVSASSDTPAENFSQRLASEDPVKKQSSSSSSAARRSSFHLWQCRRSRSWVSPPLYPGKTSPTFDSAPKPVCAQPAQVSLDFFFFFFLTISPLDRALKSHNKAKNHASLLRQKIRLQGPE